MSSTPLSGAVGSQSRGLHPAVTFIAWSLLWAGLAFVLAWLVRSVTGPSDPIGSAMPLIAPVLAAFVVGWLCRSASFAAVPAVWVILLAIWVVIDAQRTTERQFAVEAGNEIAFLFVTGIALCSAIAGATGAMLGKWLSKPKPVEG